MLKKVQAYLNQKLMKNPPRLAWFKWVYVSAMPGKLTVWRARARLLHNMYTTCSRDQSFQTLRSSVLSIGSSDINITYNKSETVVIIYQRTTTRYSGLIFCFVCRFWTRNIQAKNGGKVGSVLVNKTNKYVGQPNESLKTVDGLYQRCRLSALQATPRWGLVVTSSGYPSEGKCV